MEKSADLAPDRHRWAGSMFLLLAIAMILVDTTVVNIALPTIRHELDASQSQLQWVVAAFTLAFALLQVTAGRLGDINGRKRMVLLGISGFVVASAVCAVAPNPTVLLVGRVLQGVAGAFVVTQSLSIFQVSFPPGERATVLGLFGAVSGISAAIGPPLGGLLLSLDIAGLSWRPIFLINLPIGVITLVGAVLFVRESRAAHGPRLDIAGAIGLTIALLALLYPLIQGQSLGWVWAAVIMIASIPLFALFWRSQKAKERAGRDPLVPPSLFRQRAFTVGLAVCLVFFGSAFSLFFVFAMYLQEGLGFTPLQAGLTTMASPLATVVSAILSGALAARFGVRVLTAGTATAALGQLGLLLTVGWVGAGATPWHFVPGMVLAGIGVGLVVGPIVDMVLDRVPLDAAGAASGLLNTADQLGVATGIALIGAIFFAGVGAAEEGGAPAVTAYAGGLQTALAVNVCLLVVCAGMTFLLPRAQRRKPSQTTTSPDRSAEPVAGGDT